MDVAARHADGGVTGRNQHEVWAANTRAKRAAACYQGWGPGCSNFTTRMIATMVSPTRREARQSPKKASTWLRRRHAVSGATWSPPQPSLADRVLAHRHYWLPWELSFVIVPVGATGARFGSCRARQRHSQLWKCGVLGYSKLVTFENHHIIRPRHHLHPPKFGRTKLARSHFGIGYMRWCGFYITSTPTMCHRTAMTHPDLAPLHFPTTS